MFSIEIPYNRNIKGNIRRKSAVMKEIHLGRILVQNRHKHGITQEELAAYIGVSKAAVSKWETGNTYPDIVLLPKLASFFNISVDELIGYKPQMTREDIRKLYHQLTNEFSSLPLDTVLEHCRKIVKDYFSCFPLLFQIGSLLVNHSMLTQNSEKTTQILEEARDLFIRVRTETDDMELAKQALSMEAFCFLSLGQPDKVLDLLESSDFISPILPPEPLLASAYQMMNNIEAAKRISQTGIYQSVINLFHLLSSYLRLCLDDPVSFEETYQRTIALVDIFQIQTLHPGILMAFYISAAQAYMTLGNTEKVISLLEQYTQLVNSNIYPLHLHGDSYFYLLDDWLENTLALGSDLPRNEKVIRQSMIDAVRNNPIFTPLKDHARFQAILLHLKTKEEEYR